MSRVDYDDRSRYDHVYGDDRGRSSVSWWIWLVMLALAASVVGGIWYLLQHDRPSRARVEAVPPATTPIPDQEPATPEIRYPVPAAEIEPENLPTLDDSDTSIAKLVAGLIGQKSFDAFVNPQQLVRRIVVTVDNLPRKVAPVRMRAIKPVAGKFTPGADNRLRYAAYVKAFTALDARVLVGGYRKLYPLFQSAYAETGKPAAYFNDRVVEAIDDMLAAPDLADPPALEQPKVMYIYANPDLESRSAGQKFMMRLGAANAAAVKTKLREIRTELTTVRS